MKLRSCGSVFTTFAACIAAVVIFLGSSAFAATPISYQARFVECWDGDTCTFELQLAFGHRQSVDVRYCDIDAPESHGSTRARGIEAKHWMVAHLAKAQEVVVVVPQKDPCTRQGQCARRSFNRVMGWVVADGVNLGTALVEAGLASIYTRQTCGKGAP